jgi:hypothetical protein
MPSCLSGPVCTGSNSNVYMFLFSVAFPLVVTLRYCPRNVMHEFGSEKEANTCESCHKKKYQCCLHTVSFLLFGLRS